MRVAAVTRGVFHRARTVAPQRPFERPAPDFVCMATWPPPSRLSTPFHPRRPFRAVGGQAPVHAPRCQREARFYEPRRCLPISATFHRRAGTPDERSILAREWGFRPATRRHQPMPVALVPRCVAAPGTCEPRSVRAGFRRRVPLAWTGQTVGRGARAKADARSWTIRACPPRSAPSTRVADSTRREVWRTPRLVAPA